MGHYLVTGGAGFIGSHLVDALLERGHAVRVLDNFSTGKRENIAHCLDRIELVEGDLTDLEAARRAVSGVDGVFHQAALPSVPRSVADPLASHHANVTGTLHILVAARDAGLARVVYASSSSVYGDSPTLPKREDMPTHPLSPYAVSKLAGEHYCQAFNRVYGMSNIALRYFNVFGPRQDPTSPYAAVIPIFVRRMRGGRPPVIFGDGRQSRDFTFVREVVRANLLAAEADPDVKGVFNVACGARHTLLELVDELNGLLGRAHRPEFAPPRPGDVKHSQADIVRIGAALGFAPQIDFREGLRRTVDATG